MLEIFIEGVFDIYGFGLGSVPVAILVDIIVIIIVVVCHACYEGRGRLCLVGGVVP